MKRHPLIALTLAGALMLAACSSDGGSQVGRLAREGAQVEATVTLPSPAPTETQDFGNAQPALIAQPVYIEVTRETVQLQQVEVTRIVEVVITPTPDIAGFQDAAGIDESIQPCPIRYWKRGRCIANDATVEAYASEVQP